MAQQYQGSADGIVYWTTPRQTRQFVSSMDCDHVSTACIFCATPQENLELGLVDLPIGAALHSIG